MSEIITSQQNQRVKDAIKLRDRRGREKLQRIIIDGVREIGRALRANLAWDEAFVCERMLDEGASAVFAQLQSAHAQMLQVTPPVFAKLAYGGRSEGIVAIAKTPRRDLDGLELGPAPIVAVLEGIEKPGNVGAVVRTADAAGIDAVLLASPQTDPFNPNTIRASQGAIFTLPVAAGESVEVRSWLQKRQFRLLAARVDGMVDYREADFHGPVAIVLGSEAGGLTDAWRGANITDVRLPMLGEIDSLNVSVTAGVLFYEALRQRGAMER